MEVSSLRLAGMFTTVNYIIVFFLCLLHFQDFSMLAGLCFDDRMLGQTELGNLRKSAQWGEFLLLAVRYCQLDRI